MHLAAQKFYFKGKEIDSQKSYVILLSNGTQTSGKILNIDPEKGITIYFSKNSTYTYKTDQVLSISDFPQYGVAAGVQATRGPRCFVCRGRCVREPSAAGFPTHCLVRVLLRRARCRGCGCRAQPEKQQCGHPVDSLLHRPQCRTRRRRCHQSLYQVHGFKTLCG